MKKTISKKLSLAFASAAFSLAVSFSAMAAAPAGALEGADHASVYGWVWDSDDYGHVIPVEISVSPAGSSEVLKTATVKADHYQEELQESIGDGYHGFLYPVDWDQFDEEDFRITAYAADGAERVFLGELTYHKDSGQSAPGTVEGTFSGTAAPQGSPENQSSPQGPGEISVSKQAPGASVQAAASSPNKDVSPVSTQAPGTSAQATASSPNKDVGPVSTQASGTSVQAASLPNEDVSPVSTQAPEASAQADGTGSTANAQSGAYTASSGSFGKASASPLLSWEKGPGAVPKKEAQPEEAPVSLGMFTVTGYCGCEICCPSSSSASGLTYSGTEPQPEHTVSADINVFPIGTRLMIDGITYTVEDVGSEVTENKIDIFYATHEEALAHGTTIKEVFAVTG